MSVENVSIEYPNENFSFSSVDACCKKKKCCKKYERKGKFCGKCPQR